MLQGKMVCGSIEHTQILFLIHTYVEILYFFKDKQKYGLMDS